MNDEMYGDPELVRAFDRYGQEYNGLYDRPYVIELAAVRPRMRVLDVACGPGLHAAELQSAGALVVGLDLSQPMLARARNRLGADAGLVTATFDAPLPFRPASFDLVVCASALNYLPDPTPALVEFRRVARADGAIVISTRHPMTDWIRKGGSYYDVVLESDTFSVDGIDREWSETFYRQPLSRLCEAVHQAGLLIDRLLEPLPSQEMARLRPSHYQFLQQRPTFVVLRLVPQPRSSSCVPEQ